MAIIPEASAIKLRGDYETTVFPSTGTQRNVSAAYFDLNDVKALIAKLPAGTLYIRIALVLENDPITTGAKHVTMTMSGGDLAQNMVSAIITGTGNEVLLADRACPPDCAGHKVSKKKIIG